MIDETLIESRVNLISGATTEKVDVSVYIVASAVSVWPEFVKIIAIIFSQSDSSWKYSFDVQIVLLQHSQHCTLIQCI